MNWPLLANYMVDIFHLYHFLYLNVSIIWTVQKWKIFVKEEFVIAFLSLEKTMVMFAILINTVFWSPN